MSSPNGQFNSGLYDYADSFDPRTGVGLFASKGATFRYAPVTGPAVLLMKQDNGQTTNWTDVGVSGSVVSVNGRTGVVNFLPSEKMP